MRHIVAVLLVVVLAVGVSAAGQNPDCKVFVTFADTSAMNYAALTNRLDPAAYTAFDAYFGILDYYCFTAVSFKVGVTAGMSSPGAYDNLMPSGLYIGGFEEGTTAVSSEALYSATEGPFYLFAVGHYFYLDSPGEIKILDHPDFPRWVVDGEDHTNYYCVWRNGGVGMDAAVVEEECFGDVPVEASSWGVIKSLYR
jgi:hypothetical protein